MGRIACLTYEPSNYTLSHPHPPPPSYKIQIIFVRFKIQVVFVTNKKIANCLCLSYSQ